MAPAEGARRAERFRLPPTARPARARDRSSPDGVGRAACPCGRAFDQGPSCRRRAAVRSGEPALWARRRSRTDCRRAASSPPPGSRSLRRWWRRATRPGCDLLPRRPCANAVVRRGGPVWFRSDRGRQGSPAPALRHLRARGSTHRARRPTARAAVRARPRASFCQDRHAPHASRHSGRHRPFAVRRRRDRRRVRVTAVRLGPGHPAAYRTLLGAVPRVRPPAHGQSGRGP